MEDDSCDTLCTFSNIPYTPAWYYKRFPGFFNVECYKILASWDDGVPAREEVVSMDDVVIEEVQENKKRKYTSENLDFDEHELRSTIEQEHHQGGS